MTTLSFTITGAPVKPLLPFSTREDHVVPHHLAGLLVEGDHAAVDRADVDLAVADGQAAVVGVVERAFGTLLVDLGLVLQMNAPVAASSAQT